MMAKAATENEPASNMVVSLSWVPSTINSPRPPPPMNVAKVALATTCTAEVRMPAKITGAAIGSCMRLSTWLPERPIPRAASMMSRRTSLRPVDALMRMGGIARAVSATSAVSKPKPRKGWQSARMASDGTARPMLPMLTANASPREVFLIASATGSAMAMAMSRAAAERRMCCLSSSKKSGRLRTSSIPDILCLPPARPGPQVALQAEEREVGDDGKGGREDGPGDDHGREAAVDAVEDHLPKATAGDVGADRRDPDYRDGRYADASNDHRQRQRELDPEEDLAVRQSHPARSVYGLRRDGVEPRDGVADQDEERVGDERDDDGRRPDGYAGDGEEDAEEGQTWYGVEQPRNEGDGRVGLAVAGDEHASWQRDHERYRDRDEREEDVALYRRHYVFPEVIRDPIPLYELWILDGREVL